MVFGRADKCDFEGPAISPIASASGDDPKTLREWVRQAETDGSRRPGLTTDVVLEVAHASQ